VSPTQNLYKHCTRFKVKAQPRSIIWSLEVKVTFEKPLTTPACIKVDWPSGEESLVDQTDISKSASLLAQQPDITLQGGRIHLAVYGMEEKDVMFNNLKIDFIVHYKTSDFNEFESRIFWSSRMTGKELMLLQKTIQK
jgi:hypothetical protein